MRRCGLSTGRNRQRAVAALGLGGNIGDPVAAMARALQQHDERGDCRVIAVSALYRTPPWGKTEQADFFNGRAIIATHLHTDALLDACIDYARGQKRHHRRPWGTRITEGGP